MNKEFLGKKVLMIVENLPAPFDRRVWREALALKEKGAEVTIICPTGRGFTKKFEIIDDIHIYRHNMLMEAEGALGYFIEYPLALLQEFFLSLKCFIKRGFDVIHICNPPDLLFLVALPYKLFGKKLVFDHHDINPELYISKFNKKDLIYRTLLFLEKKTMDFANISIATNQSYRDIAINRNKKAPEDVFIVRSNPDLSKIKPVPKDPSLKKGRKYLVGYVGVIGQQEGLRYLVHACKHIVENKKRNDVHFICVGSGPDLENIKNYAKEQKVSDFFSFTGWVPDRDLLQSLCTAEICVNPDEYNEMNDKSTMNKIMEYMALGKPIVQFSLKEGRYTAGEASLYAKPNNPYDMGEKILFLLDNPLKRREMEKIARKRIKEKFQWKYEKENLYKAYRKLFATS